ncbi:MAG: hypothetical protein ACE5G2_03025 [Candidatus Krumholzibacteriia bacterium]
MHDGSRVRIAAIAAAVASMLLHGPGSAQEVGVFFDEGAQTCVAAVEPFGPAVRTHLFVFAEDGTALNGAILRLLLRPGFRIRSELWPRNTTHEGSLISFNGVDVTFEGCVIAQGPVLLLSFDLVDEGLRPGPEPDVVLRLEGGTVVADSLTLTEPHLKVCDPDDPFGEEPQLIAAKSIQATLNCTGDCPCATAIGRKTWSAVKRLFLER